MNAVYAEPLRRTPTATDDRQREIGMRSRTAVLMAVWKDTRFLRRQLSSIRDQDHDNIQIWISRDCDEERMGAILDEEASKFGTNRFFILAGPKAGCSSNFLSLICNTDIQADYFAYSDQDDVWERDKLSRAIAELELVPPTIPAVYGSRAYIIDANGNNLGLFPFHGREPGFRNALVQNIASGHTMVMNRAAREILLAADITDVPFHDWWTYLLVTGAEGRFFYDLRSTVQYRQHDRNLTGAPPRNLKDQILRIRRIFNGQVKDINRANLRALQTVKALLTPENQDILDTYCEALRMNGLARVHGLWKSGVYRQTSIGNVGLFSAALLNRL